MKGKFAIHRVAIGCGSEVWAEIQDAHLTRLEQEEYSMLNLAEIATKEVGSSIFSFTLN
jgi:hypothetical protein